MEGAADSSLMYSAASNFVLSVADCASLANGVPAELSSDSREHSKGGASCGPEQSVTSVISSGIEVITARGLRLSDVGDGCLGATIPASSAGVCGLALSYNADAVWSVSTSALILVTMETRDCATGCS
jgi:hypothetical protein